MQNWESAAGRWSEKTSLREVNRNSGTPCPDVTSCVGTGRMDRKQQRRKLTAGFCSALMSGGLNTLSEGRVGTKERWRRH